MKRIHIHIGVDALDQGISFYSTLFGQPPTTLKDDYAKWMLENPRINLAISSRTGTVGMQHLGIQVDEPDELEDLRQRFSDAEVRTYDEGEVTCCYARSDKSWAMDPAGISWEAFRSFESDVEEVVPPAGRCCIS